MSLFASVSNHTQHVLTEVLSDLPWADAFLASNAEALEGSYDVLAAVLDDAGEASLRCLCVSVCVGSGVGWGGLKVAGLRVRVTLNST